MVHDLCFLKSGTEGGGPSRVHRPGADPPANEEERQPDQVTYA
ncbi:hypothetical protein Ga0080559_TMP3197 [Salipiger profundus]|uniref:Uncharacterized protein n=1 Tax=Salipiger profundus TaxID=1229727 RepID=A0A1U7D795_9RHOB|nr:hypothetical protein Ga0080559_TMP3197 [Salipiger profundus]